MGTIGEKDWDEEYSVIGDKGEISFLDYGADKSLYNFDPLDQEGPVLISAPFPFIEGKPQSAPIGETKADSIDIKNTTGDPVELWSVRIYSSIPEDSYILSLMKPPSSSADEKSINQFVGSTVLEDRVLQPGQTLTIWLSCTPKSIGMHSTAVHFDVGDDKIERTAWLLAEDEVSQILFARKPYSRAPSRGMKSNYNSNEYVSGSRPPRKNTQGFRFMLPEFSIPQSIREIVESKQVPDVIMEGLNSSNYSKYFSTLIVMEEIHMEEEMRVHFMEHVTMKRRNYLFLSLEVPGLAERRPSLVCGDYILAKLAYGHAHDDLRSYQGYIHRVEADNIFLKFDKKLHERHRDGDLYNVSFSYNRINMRRLYQAVQAAENLGSELLFPHQSPHRRFIRTFKLNPFNQNLNTEQVKSVQKILGCKGSPPYIIYGPPGTGKTMTLVEAILQLYAHHRKARILVCASSNSAADHVLEKLLGSEGGGVQETEILRLNAMSRPYDDVKPELLKFCVSEDMVFKCPPLRDLLHYKIVISTYMSASLLYAEGIRKGHFSHIFLDEAGQACEPETMVPISNLCVKQTVIVLAGDPKQLGPVIYSKDAENYGFGKSYLERLFELEHYGCGDENYVTKLVRNYRCHPAILELPSKLFYNDELIACKEENESIIYDWTELPNKSFPLYFVGIQGCDEREGNNPSWFNRTEASKVVDIIKKLMTNVSMDGADIGVITPYRQQVLKLKKALESLDMADVKVGTVEQFQGQERQIIIISTVRSTIKHNDFDRAHNLGFLSNPRRFNVAITRAKSLLIIVGNPHIIAKDPYWDKLLRYCVDNGAYQGCPLPPPEIHTFFDEPSNDQDDIPDPNQYNEVEWNEQVPRQYSNDVEWEESVPIQYPNEVPWDENIPKQYTNEVEWDESIPNQHSNGVEGDENVPKQLSSEVGWDVPKQHSNEVQQDENVPKQCSNEAKLSEEVGKQPDDVEGCEDEKASWGEAYEPYCDEVEWGENTSRTYTDGIEWNDNTSKPYSCGIKWGNETIIPTGWDD